jgi:hypothetical protein
MPAEKLEYQQLLYNAYDRILNNSKPKLDDSGYVECLVVSHSGETVRNRHANTFKVSFGKGKRLAHRVIYEAHHGPPLLIWMFLIYVIMSLVARLNTFAKSLMLII